jgi:hypothetical protein
LAKPLPIAQIRKTRPEVIVEIDQFLDHYCDCEVAEVPKPGRATDLAERTLQPQKDCSHPAVL